MHQTKSSRTGPLTALAGGGRAVWTPKNHAALAREGFAGNAVGYRCLRMLAEAAAAVPFVLYDGLEELEQHPLLALLARPNPAESGRGLMERFYGQLLLAGNAYLEAVKLGEAVRELHTLRPDRMRLIAGRSGWPEAYDYVVNGQAIRFHQDGAVPPILHLKLLNPADDHYGLSPIEAAARAIDIHNAAGAWSKALFDNAARPSGALVYKGGEGNLTDEQFDRLRQELEASHQGSANAGRPLILEGGLEWTQISHSPRDMDHLEARHAAAREIALAFGVPPMLLGIPGDNTFANYAEANRSFWRQSVLPLASRTAEALSHWLTPAFGDQARLRLGLDLDAVEALSPEREALWARLANAPFLSDAEKRQAVGYGSEE
jgi:HK97 family phage portal protein